jgi:phenylacetate-CoA ligase
MDIQTWLMVTPFSLLRFMRHSGFRRDELVKLQNKKLRRLVKHSFENVAYYNKLFKASGIRPDDIRTVDDLDKIPISKKTDFSDLQLREIVASDINLSKCRLLGTSGTSGIKLEFYHENKFLLQTLLRIYLWQLEAGDKISNRHFMIGGCWILPTALERLGIFTAKRVSPFLDTLTQIKQIIEYNPDAMIMLPSALKVVADEIIDQQIRVKIPLIFTGGEMLDAHTRRLAQEAFDAEVFDGYGTTEVSGICGECRAHIGQHTFGDQTIVEISRDGEKVSTGEKGCVTVTSLDNYATPFIRYNTEDIGMLLDDECNCGLHYPLMRITEGRASDTIVLNDGGRMSAHEVCVSVCKIEGIKQFQIIQESDNGFIVKVVTKSGFIDELCENVVQVVERALGEVDVEVLIVDDIPRLKSGKFKQFISKVR